MLPAWTRRASANKEGEGSRKRPRTRSVRTRITALLVVPLLSLIALWGFAASVTVGAALNMYDLATTYDKISTPDIFLVDQLVEERTLTALYVGSHGRQGRQQLQEQRLRTNAAQEYFRNPALIDNVKGAASTTIQRRLAEINQQLEQLGTLRDSIDSNQIDIVHVIAAYGDMVDATIRLFNSAVIVDDLGIFQQGRGIISIGWSLEFMMREFALVTAVQADGGRMTVAEHTAFVQWSAQRRQTFATGLADLYGAPLDSVQRLTQSEEFLRYQAMENFIVSSKPTVRPPPGVWQSTITPLSVSWTQMVQQEFTLLNKRAQPIGDQILLRLIVAGGLGLIAVVASIILSITFGRSLSRELGGLQRAARDLAEERLPRVVAMLRAGNQNVDVDAEAPPLRIGKTTEIARVADAFTRVQRTAIDTAVGEAHLRTGVSRVFLNLAWRSQSLLHRQLRMLDAMERRASEPEELEDLFRLDHLTTRMRRHAEGLVILSGAPAGRGWSRPVQIVDVLRGALGEVEDYTRVDVVATTPASLAAAAVADVIHLLAELIENATEYSPPPTEVLVRGELVANGFAVEIVDRGIGLSTDELAELNHRLVHPPDFDLANSDRLGLFVVSRLAARHRINVTLQPSAYGGTTAVVLIPRELVIQGGEPALESAADRHQPNGATPIPVSSGSNGWFEPRQITSSAVAHVDVDVDTEDEGELPRRIRQASLVPQLREESPAPFEDSAAERRPEETRDLMASLQTGWLRGRGDEEDDLGPFEQRKERGDA